MTSCVKKFSTRHREGDFMFRKFIAALLSVLLLLSLCACGKQTPYVEKIGFAMGSVVNVRIYGSDRADTITQDVLKAIGETDNLISANIVGSDIYKINESKKGQVVGKETFRLLGDCLSVSNTTGNVLDITIGAVSELWGFDGENPSLPNKTDLANALQTVDQQNLTMNEESLTVNKAEGQKIDLGAFGKGIACEKALTVLQREFSPAVLSVGGTVLLYGNHPDEDRWTVGVRNPYGDADTYCATLALQTEGKGGKLVVSTSGNYEKTFTQNDKTYHHILDSETGLPVENDILGVTVVAEGGMISDALSTVLFIHGLSQESLQIIENYRVGAVFLCKDGSVLVSDSLADKITVTDKAWTPGDLEDTINALQ